MQAGPISNKVKKKVLRKDSFRRRDLHSKMIINWHVQTGVKKADQYREHVLRMK